MARVDPDLWQIPRWHADWDGPFQFAGLRTFANALHDGTDLNARLSIIEEGYARLEVFDSETLVGVAYVNRGDDASILLFTIFAGAEGDELTTADIAAAVRFLTQRPTAFPREDG